MKSWLSIIVILAVALGAAVAPSAGQTTYTFQPSDGDWDVEGNWLPLGGPPDSDDTAVIPQGRTCRVDTDEGCKNLTLAGPNAESISRLVIEAGHSLTIHGGEGDFEHADLELDGTTSATAVLKISGEVLIMGDDANILMSYALIDDNGGQSDELTIDIPANPGGAFFVEGDGEIKVTLVNKAVVVANHEGKTLALSEGAKEGTQGSSPYRPIWEARYGGTLQVDVEVTGEGSWNVGIAESSNDGTQIVIGVCCDDLTGDVLLVGGTLKVEDTFCATGHLSWTPDAVSTPTIHVDKGVSATFHGPCPTECD